MICYKRSYATIKLLQGHKDSSTHGNLSMRYVNRKISHFILSIDVEKVSDEIQYPFMLKILNKVGTSGNGGCTLTQ